ncbi:stage III sporulation protein AG [Pseudalkalibacillus caeni]|uniref:Stage III sporulation protein AG n=1 Tax=Exobacillus caeni TaxID=2574798 RepID=A0A5R9F1P4_9BACL|nr:stage III sporulation protein AG [Pseudalkalibacillus caeni]TLS36370.1 stage III sporulation protein AG [Pseudalkalibacillus caeni]
MKQDEFTKYLEKLFPPGKKKKGFPKQYIVMVVAIGAMLMIVSNMMSSPEPAEPVSSNMQPANEEGSEPAFGDNKSSPSSIVDYENRYENELKEALDLITGVSDVNVVVNLETSPQKIIEKNRSTNKKYTHESDKQGGNRKIEEEVSEEEAVIIQDGNKQEPIVLTTEKPRVRGVLVVAKGAENIQIKKMIVDAVTRVLDVPYHRVAVMPKKSKGE